MYYGISEKNADEYDLFLSQPVFIAPSFLFQLLHINSPLPPHEAAATVHDYSRPASKRQSSHLLFTCDQALANIEEGVIWLAVPYVVKHLR